MVLAKEERQGEEQALHLVLQVLLSLRRKIIAGARGGAREDLHTGWVPFWTSALKNLAATGRILEKRHHVPSVLAYSSKVASQLAFEIAKSEGETAIARKRNSQLSVEFLRGYMSVIAGAAVTCAVIAAELAEPQSPPPQPVTAENGAPLPLFPPTVERGFLAPLHTSDYWMVVGTALKWIGVVERRIWARMDKLASWRTGPVTNRGTRDRRETTTKRGRPRKDGGALADAALEHLFSEKMDQRAATGKPAIAAEVYREIAEHQLRQEKGGKAATIKEVKLEAGRLKQQLARYLKKTKQG